jgi:hypothetical protein
MTDTWRSIWKKKGPGVELVGSKRETKGVPVELKKDEP